MYRAAARRSLAVAAPQKSCGPSSSVASRWARLRHSSYQSYGAPPPNPPPRWGKPLALLSGVALAGSASWYFWPAQDAVTDDALGKPQSGVPQAEIEFEKPRNAASGDEDRDLISSQHVQIKKSWQNPGVYAWGTNLGKVVAPDSAEPVVKTPRRIRYFDGMILRDLKLDRKFGVAVTEEGDIVQWGVGFSPEATAPIPTLTGKDITKVATSNDRIIALSKSGSVYTLPVSQADQQNGIKPKESSWVPFWSGSGSPVSYQTLTPKDLEWGEKVVDVASGINHCLLLTSYGRVFSAASSTESFPSKGELGIAGLTWLKRPDGPYNQLHEVKGLSTAGIAQIATGLSHSVALDKAGRVFAWGDNSSGQLGFAVDPLGPAVDSPRIVPLEKLYPRNGPRPSVTSIAAGGSNSYFTIDGPSMSDTWACGSGILGTLGSGKWTHISSAPTRINALSGLSEYDDAKRSSVPIRVARISVGSTHAAAIMGNITSSSAKTDSSYSTAGAANWGADVLWWGGNEHHQLGTGRRKNQSEPAYLAPLDSGKVGRGGEMHRFQLAPPQTVRIGEGGKGRKVCLEQRVECGSFVTAVYSATADQ